MVGDIFFVSGKAFVTITGFSVTRHLVRETAAVAVSVATVGRVRERFVEQGLEAALVPRPTGRAYARRLDGVAEAKLVTLACSAPPEGRAGWTLRLLAERLVALEVVGSVSHETVRQVLKKTWSSRG